jgi:hypothetical protein
MGIYGIIIFQEVLGRTNLLPLDRNGPHRKTKFRGNTEAHRQQSDLISLTSLKFLKIMGDTYRWTQTDTKTDSKVIS